MGDLFQKGQELYSLMHARYEQGGHSPKQTEVYAKWLDLFNQTSDFDEWNKRMDEENLMFEMGKAQLIDQETLKTQAATEKENFIIAAGYQKLVDLAKDATDDENMLKTHEEQCAINREINIAQDRLFDHIDNLYGTAFEYDLYDEIIIMDRVSDLIAIRGTTADEMISDNTTDEIARTGIYDDFQTALKKLKELYPDFEPESLLECAMFPFIRRKLSFTDEQIKHYTDLIFKLLDTEIPEAYYEMLKRHGYSIDLGLGTAEEKVIAARYLIINKFKPWLKFLHLPKEEALAMKDKLSPKEIEWLEMSLPILEEIPERRDDLDNLQKDGHTRARETLCLAEAPFGKAGPYNYDKLFDIQSDVGVKGLGIYNTALSSGLAPYYEDVFIALIPEKMKETWIDNVEHIIFKLKSIIYYKGEVPRYQRLVETKENAKENEAKRKKLREDEENIKALVVE